MELGHAWCQWLADTHGIRILFLKGPALAEYSLRPPRPSTDIDVLVDPQKWDEFVDVATGAGWVEREYTAARQMLSPHSRNFVRANWPCDLDLHRHYPGFLAPPENVFETLWSRRSEIELGKVWCQVPDRNAAILILALHSLRGESAQPRHARELRELIAQARLSPTEIADLGLLSRLVGCVSTLGLVLNDLGVSVPAPEWEHDSPELADWRGLVASGASGTYRWLHALRASPPADRLHVVREALWPSDRDLMLDHPSLSGGVVEMRRARVARLIRGLKALPRALMAILVSELPHQWRVMALRRRSVPDSAEVVDRGRARMASGDRLRNGART